MRTPRIVPPLIAFLAMIGLLRADQILLTSGEAIKGSVLRRDGDDVVVGLDYGVVRYNAQSIKSVNGKPIPTTGMMAAVPSLKPNQFPKWREIVSALLSKSWASDFRQIPATVIDKGVMKNVPYISFKCGGDYEMNIYDDPDNPASVEIGLYRSLLTSEEAKKNCIEFIASILGDKLQRDVLKVMDRRKSLFEHDGMSMEITPETDEDAYGGWWVSAYKEKALDAARAPDSIVASISVPTKAGVATNVEADPLAWSSSDMRYARKSTPVSGVPSATVSISASTQTSTPEVASSTNSSPSDYSGYGGDRVYVRGYYRKNGTYVHSYTRGK